MFFSSAVVFLADLLADLGGAASRGHPPSFTMIAATCSPSCIASTELWALLGMPRMTLPWGTKSQLRCDVFHVPGGPALEPTVGSRSQVTVLKTNRALLEYARRHLRERLAKHPLRR